METDYFLLQEQARREMDGFRMPGDGEKLKLIEDERRRDFDALLSPAEKVDYDLRFSDTARRMQRDFVSFDMTEAEYNAIYALQREVSEKFSASKLVELSIYGGADVSEYLRAQREAQNKVDKQIEKALGEER